jgi:16S rRNA (cytosine1402-N4)-methyltransferase
MEATAHFPVMLNEVTRLFVEHLTDFNAPTFLDGTLGGGGHTEALLKQFTASNVLAFDQDVSAIERASQRLVGFKERVVIEHTNFRYASEKIGAQKFDGILLDLGISSDQLDNLERGFSFKDTASLDMRMNQQEGPTAQELLNTLSQKELARIFLQGGVRNLSHRLADEVIRRRPLNTATDFVSVCAQVLDSPRERRLRGNKEKNPATVPFQALRMEVNDELGAIKDFLDSAPKLVSPGAVLAIITFHSLEDELVTRKFRAWDKVGAPTRNLPAQQRIGNHLTQKPIEPSEEEISKNPRSRSARLRAFKFQGLNGGM